MHTYVHSGAGFRVFCAFMCTNWKYIKVLFSVVSEHLGASDNGNGKMKEEEGDHLEKCESKSENWKIER